MTKTTSQSIKLTHEDDQWVAVDDETGIASQGDTREKALLNLDEALELTREAKESKTEAVEPTAPWFE
jgi:predicted RNase H-like HicB family nuclease